jgi:hypothetical protein
MPAPLSCVRRSTLAPKAPRPTLGFGGGGSRSLSGCIGFGELNWKACVYEQDYILRIIGMWGQAIRRALEALRLGHEAEALDMTEHALRLALDTDPTLALKLTPEGLVAYLRIGGAIDPRRAQMLADALDARARVLLEMRRDAEADLDLARAEAVRDAAGIVATDLDAFAAEAPVDDGGEDGTQDVAADDVRREDEGRRHVDPASASG